MKHYMHPYLPKVYKNMLVASLCICLFLLSACQASSSTNSGASSTPRDCRGAMNCAPTIPAPTPASATPTPAQSITIPRIVVSSTPGTPTPTSSATPATTNRPVLAFYYMWYSSSTWCSCTMSDLPQTHYTSSDDTIIDQQLSEASRASITGFINSWWGPGDVTDKNFVKLLAHSATLESTTGYHFASSIYFESDAPALSGTSNTVSALRYLISNYSNDAHFFHWKGKAVIFFWNPLGNGRTLSQWAAIRSQVDPNNQTIWSAEGIDTNLLSVFDGLHLFSAGYWGIQNGDMNSVDKGFRDKIDAYNQAHQAQKIWAAGVLPGYDDTRVPGRKGTYVVPRNNGATYRTSWTGAIASNPDWVTITSFNEWFEGAMIEPSVHYGDLYLNLTQQYTKQWHG